jgi:RNA polymerase sigma factor (sigma-70 family)
MPTPERLADQFETHRAHLRAVAYRMLGSVSDAEDAVQESWIRFGRTDVSDVENLRGWLTTVVARVCLDLLRTRASRREDPLETHVPDPILSAAPVDDGPEALVMRADTVGLALLIVFDTLTPDERLAFVLHDVFGMTFDEIAPVAERSVEATRQLASRARRKVRARTPVPEASLRAQRSVVEAFLAAVRDANVPALVAVLHPDIVLRADGGAAQGLSRIVRGAGEIVSQAAAFSRIGLSSQVVLINGQAGLLSRLPDGRVFSVLGFTVANGQVVEINILADAARLARLDIEGIGA